MENELGRNAEKWIEMILSFRGDPSKFNLPEIIFNLPDTEDINKLLEIAKETWINIDSRVEKPHVNLEETMPFWIVFALPRRPAMVYFAVWDRYFFNKNKRVYNDGWYRFQSLMQNFMREELYLFKTVRPMRKILGLDSKNNIEIELDEELKDILNNYSTPQKMIKSINKFVKNRTLKFAQSYVLMIEKLSVLLSRYQEPNKVNEIIQNFKKNLHKLEQISQKRPSKLKEKTQYTEIIEEDTTEGEEVDFREIVEFEKVILQEYDGYVEITGTSPEEQRNFRIYNCKEEDQLREKIWKENRYPIRSLVEDILQDRYSTSEKLYKLKWGVEIEIKEPNWLT